MPEQIHGHPPPAGGSDHVNTARQQRVVDLLEHNVQTEVTIWSSLEGLALTHEQVERLTFMVTSEILYSFDLDWAPDWVKAGGVHTWKDGDRWFSRCGICLMDSPGMAREEPARTWAHQHEDSHGGDSV
jgi:hypothetical protein